MLAAKRPVGVTPEVDRGMYITFPSAKKTTTNKAKPTLALTPRGDVTRNPKQGVPVAQKRDVCPPKLFLNKKSRIYGTSDLSEINFAQMFCTFEAYSVHLRPQMYRYCSLIGSEASHDKIN